jgi:hypothetical protein
MPWLSIVRHIPDAVAALAFLYLIIPTVMDNVGPRSSSRALVRGKESDCDDLQERPEQNH